MRLASALGWLVRDTFRQARSTRLFWAILAVTGLCVLLCLGLRIDGPRTLKPVGEIELVGPDGEPLTGPTPDLGRLSLGFGLVRVGLFRDAESALRFLQVVLAKWAAGVAGTLLMVIGAAGFLPEFLRPDSASVLLAKPLGRRALLWVRSSGSRLMSRSTRRCSSPAPGSGWASGRASGPPNTSGRCPCCS